MSLHNTIKEICEGLRSARLNERKKNADALKIYLTRNAVPSLLTENSLNKKGYTWNDIYDDINEYIYKELEKHETSKTFESVTEPLCTSLLHLCVAGSNKGRTYIKCEKVIEPCLNILKDSHLAKAIGDAYLNLLYKYILPCEHYFQHITPSTWEELLDVIIVACIKKYSKLDDFTKLRILLLIVNSARNNCQFVIPLKNTLSKFTKLFLEVPHDWKGQEVIVEIGISLLETLSSEYRLSMCYFVESILSPVLKLYDQNQDHKKKCLIFKLLHSSVVLHHPKGRLQSEEGSLAGDWCIWNKHLNAILEIIHLEVTYLQKICKQNINAYKQSKSFYNISASVYYQIFNQLDNRENDQESLTKRQKLSYNKNKTFSDLIDEFLHNHIPWLGVIQKFVKNYPDYVSSYDYLKIINIVETLITKINVSLVEWDILENLALLVLKNYTSSKNTVQDDNVLKSLWNSCVRSCTSLSMNHKVIHTIVQHLLKHTRQDYQNIQPIVKLYVDGAMPVSEFSLKTLCIIFHECFIKCNHEEIRIKFFTWFIQGDINFVCIKQVKALILRLLSVENINIITEFDKSDDNLYNIIFNSNEDNILFSEFESKDLKTESKQENKVEQIEINNVIEKHIQEYLTITLQKYLEDGNVELNTIFKFTHITLTYFNILMNGDSNNVHGVKDTILFNSLQIVMKESFLKLQPVLANNNTQICAKIKLLQLVRDLLETDLNPLLSTEVRLSINDRFFHCFNNIIHAEIKMEDEDVVCDEDDDLIGAVALKHHCIYTLAAFCTKISDYRAELLDLILDPKTYNFMFDLNCALQCIEILNNSSVEQPPLDLMFSLMVHMCKSLFRDSKASYKILMIVIKMLDSIWLHDITTKQNCCIMIKSYLQRCEKSFYPPNVAVLIYECVAKICALSKKYNDSIDDIFEKSIIDKTKGDIKSIRLYCCYLISSNLNYFFEDNIDTIYTSISDSFSIKVSNKKESILKDELSNRTSTALHLFLAIAYTKKSLTLTIVNRIIRLQREKSLNPQMVKKILNKVVSSVNINNIETYLDRNILSLLHFWFTKNYNIKDLPFYLFGCDNMDIFVEKYKEWLIPSYVLWCKKGNLKDVSVLQDLNINNTLENILEDCFSSIIVLCLPYVSVERSKIICVSDSDLPINFNQYIKYADEMIKLTGQILLTDKWTNLFTKNIDRLLLLITMCIRDHVETKLCFQVNIPQEITSFYYSKKVYLEILNFINDLTDGSIVQHLCEHQPLGIYQVLFYMWEKVVNENISELSALVLHAYITFIEIIPIGYSSDPFVCNFICNSFKHAIKDCTNRDKLNILAKGLKLILGILLPKLTSLIYQKPLSHLLPIIIMKKEESHFTDCKELLNSLIFTIKDYLNANEVVVDFIISLSQNELDHVICTSMPIFREKLHRFKLALVCPSYVTLLNMRHFLNTNKHFVRSLHSDLDQIIFSEDCRNSVIHQIVHSLTTVISSATDNKTVIEASNCLSELETYDLKSLVTVPPNDTRDVVNFKPIMCFAITCVKSLTEYLFDKDPVVTTRIAETLNNILKYFEDANTLGMEEFQTQLIQSLLPSVNAVPLDIKLNNKAFENYHSKNNKGIFVTAFTTDWLHNGKENQSDWLKQVTTSLLQLIEWGTDCVIDMRQVCASKSKICESILPALMGLIIYLANEQQIQIMSEQINIMLSYVWDESFNIESSIGDSHTGIKKITYLNQDQKAVVQYMLNIVDFVRLQRNHYKSRHNRVVDSLNYLKLDYDRVSWAATVADQNLDAIFYGELWAVSQNNGIPPSSPERTTNLNGGENLQQIFRKCYVSIGEMDAIDGCGTAHLTIECEKRKHLINMGQFSDALLLHDVALSNSTQNNYELHCGVVRSLYKSGMYHLALQYIKSLPENENFNDVRYECLAFLGDWSGVVDTNCLEEKFEQTNTNPNSLLKALHYACLKECHNAIINTNSEKKMSELLNTAKQGMSKLCRNLNMVNCQSVYTVVSKLRLFTDIEDYYAMRSGKSCVENIINNWHIDNLPLYNDFKYLEPLISQRVLMLEHASNSFKEFNNEILSLQIGYARLGLSNNRIQMVQRLLALMTESKSLEEIAFVESEISWAKGHKEIALSLLRNMVTHQSANIKMRAMSLRQYGLWMAESKHDNSRDIINKYLLKSLDILKDKDHAETRVKVYYDIAKFADSEYKQVVLYMNSTIFENKVKCLESLKGTTFSLKSTQQDLSRDEKKALIVNDRFRELDEAEIANTKAEKESFLQLAMRYYLLSLKHCEQNNLSVFRVISLWLDNPEFELEDDQGFSYSESLHSIPSRKFITVLPQLAPHLTNQTGSFSNKLKETINRCAVDHPHHTLPILFSLKNSDKDKLILNASSSISDSVKKIRNQEPRVIAAEALIQDLKKRNNHLTLIISQMDVMCNGIISFANYKPINKESKQNIPSAESITRLRSLNAICVPTVTLPISADCKYYNLPALHSFENYFELVGGINCPKKITCTDTIGKKRIILVKGQDDLRQDAVMQQVFNIVNNLLEKNPVTSRNKLLIRTYKVVPMSHQSGVLEWCVGTMPLGVYLGGVGNTGAHARYRPQDISCSAARQKMVSCHESRKSNKEKLIVFMSILRDFKPVFHYFFTEHYLNPVTWYERRLAYTKSVATSSMVGYILGLGDRHMHNILVDKRTGEVIHIDFGIAFDQGKTLPTPESVPFRLTQDIVAGFGSSGVEGIFRRSCEKTMQLLHDNQETLLTILEVLLCDPLYTWTLTSVQNTTNARDASIHCPGGSDSGLAKRALLSVSSKLSGTEGGLAAGVAVAGQVARLLQTATDPVNLCRLFPGWQPYL